MTTMTNSDEIHFFRCQDILLQKQQLSRKIFANKISSTVVAARDPALATDVIPGLEWS